MFIDLETDRLKLNSIGYDDTEFLCIQFSNDEVNRYLFDAEPIRTEEAAKEIIGFYLEPEPRNQHRWIMILKDMILKDSGEKIGTCGFHRWNREPGEVEVGYDLQPAYFRKGYMTEALTEIIRFAKGKMSVKKIYAHIYPENIASVKTAEKMGFVRTGEQYYEKFRGEKYLHDIYCLTL